MSSLTPESLFLQAMVIATTLSITDAVNTTIKQFVGKPADEAVAKLIYASLLTGTTLIISNHISNNKKDKESKK